MTFAGLPAVMFVETPTPEQLERFRQLPGDRHRRRRSGACRRAGWTRTCPPLFARSLQLKAPVTHYKVCSTLDSSPAVGLDRPRDRHRRAHLRRDAGAANWQPLIVAAPAIGRYQAFGNLFAASGDGVYRLDRHPVMQRHPVTPMDEADVAAARRKANRHARSVSLISPR